MSYKDFKDLVRSDVTGSPVEILETGEHCLEAMDYLKANYRPFEVIDTMAYDEFGMEIEDVLLALERAARARDWRIFEAIREFLPSGQKEICMARIPRENMPDLKG